MIRRPRLLVVDDDPAIIKVVERFGVSESFEVMGVGDGSETLAWLRPGLADVALVDLRMPKVDGLAVLGAIREKDPGCQVILMTGCPTVDTAVQAVKAGALDYLSKPFDLDRLRSLLRGVRNELERRDTVLAYESELAAKLRFCGMIGRSAGMQDLFSTIRRIARHVRSVLITGETGTGKELVAAALHQLGPRASRPLVTINCSAIVESLFESELFGHVRGAFTGAVDEKEGLFVQADDGTLLLDEVGELPLSAQAKLLRVLETGEVLRVGGLKPKKVDVRVLAATNRDLRAEALAGRFRADLYYRLSVMHLTVPPLRERTDDIPFLTAAFITEFAHTFRRTIQGIAPGAEQMLLRGSWPGNVRELRHTIERACLLAEGAYLTEREIRLSLDQGRSGFARESGEPAEDIDVSGASLMELERKQVANVLERCGGNKSKAARILGLNRRSLYRRLGKFDLH